MPGLVPGMTVFAACNIEDVDGRNKSGHDTAHQPGHDAERLCLSVGAPSTVAILHRSRAEFHFFVLVQLVVSPAQAFVRSAP
jgi:hypothetical protein